MPSQDQPRGERRRQHQRGDQESDEEERKQPGPDVARGVVRPLVVGLDPARQAEVAQNLRSTLYDWQIDLFFASCSSFFSCSLASFFHSVFGYRRSSSWK